jgi:hypothetical protein
MPKFAWTFGALSIACCVSACASTAAERPHRSADYPEGAVPPPEQAAASGPGAGSVDPATLDTKDAPEISRSKGVAGGIVVLWPRIVMPRNGPREPDAETRAVAGKLQARIAEIVRKAAPSVAIDVRPEPERVCPRSGCIARTIGVLLARASNGCAAVALVSPAGASAQQLVAWKGNIDVAQTSVPFRAPPEGAIQVQDYLRCAAIGGDPVGDEKIEAAIRELR